MDQVLTGKSVLLIISGGIAAYKSLDLIRRLRKRGASVQVVMSRAAHRFVTELSVAAISGQKVYDDLFDRDSELDVGHIRLARQADVVIVAPASADLMAKAANGLVDDLASAVLLATNAPILYAPAMNPAMWGHPATRRNVKQLADDGARFVGPNSGEMAESGEAGIGRMAEPLEIVAALTRLVDDRPKPLAGRHVIITSGPTHEAIDPVRYLANRSSGRQGHAIAAACAAAGARVSLISGPVNIADPAGVNLIKVQSAVEMHDAVHQLLPVDAAIFVAAVADWRVTSPSEGKIKKQTGSEPKPLELIENPDILASVGHSSRRPQVVVGFAAETDEIIAHGQAKLAKKGADLIVANDVSGDVMGGERNRVHLISQSEIVSWPEMDKNEVASGLVDWLVEKLSAGLVDT